MPSTQQYPEERTSRCPPVCTYETLARRAIGELARPLNILQHIKYSQFGRRTLTQHACPLCCSYSNLQLDVDRPGRPFIWLLVTCCGNRLHSLLTSGLQRPAQRLLVLVEDTRMHRYRRNRIHIRLHLTTLLDLNAIRRVLTRFYVVFKCIATFFLPRHFSCFNNLKSNFNWRLLSAGMWCGVALFKFTVVPQEAFSSDFRFSTSRMEAVCSSETSVTCYQRTRSWRQTAPQKLSKSPHSSTWELKTYIQLFAF
jgi:hypothetical protein